MATSEQVRPLTPGARAVLDAAGRLFYEQGISAVGVEAIAAEAGVTKKTLYDRFGSKAALVRLYLDERDTRYRRWVDTWITEHPDTPAPLAVFDALDAWTREQGTRGCAFLHAHADLLAEPDHPAHDVVRAQKSWLLERFRELVADAGTPEPDAVAAQLLTLHEGVTVLRSTLDDPATGRAAEWARDAAAALLGRAR